MSEQSEIHDMTFGETSEKRTEAAKQLGSSFKAFTDRKQALSDLLRLSSDKDSEVREEAINSLIVVFPEIQDKEQVWDRLVNLTAYPEEKVIRAAVNSLVGSFIFMPDRNKAWKDLVELVNSRSSLEDVSSGIVRAFPCIIPEVPDKQRVWKDLLEMIDSNTQFVKEKAASFFCMVFPELSYKGKEELWDRLLQLATESDDMKVREQAARALGMFFSRMPDEMRDEALDEMLELAVSESQEVQKEVLLALPSVISHIKEKERTWKDIIRLTGDENTYIRRKAADTLVSIFPDMPEKKNIWVDFLRLTGDKDEYVRVAAANALKFVFPYFDDKSWVWKGLVELTGDKDEFVREIAAETLVKVFPYVYDKNQAYSDLDILAEERNSFTLRELVIKLAAEYPQFNVEYKRSEIRREEVKENKEMKVSGGQGERRKDKTDGFYGLSSEKTVNFPEEIVRSENIGENKDKWNEVLKMAGDRDMGVRRNAADLIARIFPDVKEMPGVFFDLVKLTESPDAQIREKSAELFPIAFKYSDEKQRAWDELVRLASAEDRKVRRETILSLVSGYTEVLDRDKAWKDLIRLTDHSDNFVKRAATRALGRIFFLAPDKTEAWRDLQKVTSNPNKHVRKYAFRSLGRASLWRSLRAENETTYIFGIREAVKFFKAANEVPTDTSMPDLYQTFYESLLSILFSEIPGIAKFESEKYFSKLSHEIRVFGDNQQLREIINPFAELLLSAGDLPPDDLSAQKELLKFSIQTFEKFSYFFELKEEEAISAPGTMRKEHSKPGKEILERVEKRKSFLSRKL